MKIMFSHPYRLDMITRNENEVVMAMVTNEYIEDNKTIEKIDIPICTTPEMRLKDMMHILKNECDKPDVLIMNAPTDEDSLEEAKLIKEIQSLGIKVIGQTLNTCEICNNKDHTKKWLKDLGFPVSEGLELDQISECDFPIVIKEVENSSGNGVFLIYTIEELNKFVGKNVIAEKYIEGFEMSVQVICDSSGNYVSPPVYKEKTNLAMIHPLKKLRIFPNPWEPEKINPVLKKVALNIAQELCESGVIDIDFVVISENEFYILEINSRLSGVSRMINVDGFNSMDLLMEIARNGKIPFLKEDYKVTIEVPIQSQVIVEDLMSSSVVDYVYIRPDQQNLRIRILMSGESGQEIIMKGKKLAHERLLSDYYMEKILNSLGSGVPY